MRWLQRACLGFSAPFVQQRALKPTRAHPSRRWLRLLQALPRSGAAAGVAAQPSGQPSMWRAWSAVPAWQRLGRWRPSGLALWTLPCRAQCSGSATAPHALRRSEAHSCGWQALPPPPPPRANAHALPDCQFGLAQQNLQCPWHAMHFHAHVPCHAVRCCGVLSVVLCGRSVWLK